MALGNRRTTDLYALNKFSSSIDKLSFKNNSMSLGLVLLEEKLFMQMPTRTCTGTPQSDAIMSADLKKQSNFKECLMIFQTSSRNFLLSSGCSDQCFTYLSTNLLYHYNHLDIFV